MGPFKAFFLQVQPKFVSHLKLMWHLMLIMALLVLCIKLLLNILNLLADVLDLLNELGGFVIFWWSRGRVGEVVTRGSSTSMGPNGWNPNPS
jgi:hypothetical protein